MKKRLSGYIYIINICGILLCLGLFIYNMTEINKLSAQYSRLQQYVQQAMEDKEAEVQDKTRDENLGYTVEFYPELHTETAADESGTYGLEKYSYLVNEEITLSDNETDTTNK